MTVSEASAVTRPGPAAVPPGHPGAPRMLHHVTYVTYDSARTTEFYTTIMGMPLVSVVMDDHLPSTGTSTPYFHTFFRMGDGSTIAFFESPGLPPTPEYPEPAFDNFNHLALEVPSKADVDAWRRWLEDHGVDVLLVDHKIIYSIYFHDPNGVRLEITTTVVPTWNQEERKAAAALAQWVETKDRARAEGADPDERLRELIRRNAHQAQIRQERHAAEQARNQ
jgi:catechol 2,3-dioxygenase-like lactoylglutathione lyase family enzyme